MDRVARRWASPPGGGRTAAARSSGRRSEDHTRTRLNSAASLSTVTTSWNSARSYLSERGRDARNPARRPAASAADRRLLQQFEPFCDLTDCTCRGGCDPTAAGAVTATPSVSRATSPAVSAPRAAPASCLCDGAMAGQRPEPPTGQSCSQTMGAAPVPCVAIRGWHSSPQPLAAKWAQRPHTTPSSRSRRS